MSSNVTPLMRDTEAETETPNSAFGFEDVPPIMSPKTLAGILEVTTLTLQRWRDRNEGPVAISIPGSNVIRYTRTDLLAWLAEHRVAGAGVRS